MKIRLKILGFAANIPCPIAGEWVARYDPDACDGRGYIVSTPKPEEALTFDTMSEAFAFYRQQSKVRPSRPDGKANRPLTASHIEFEKVE